MRYIKGDFTLVPNSSSLEGQSPSVQTVYKWICKHADNDGICFPSRRLLSQKSGVTIKTVDNCIKKLVKMGIIAKKSRKIGKENVSNTYQIIIVEKGGRVIGSPPSVKSTPLTITTNYIYPLTGDKRSMKPTKSIKYHEGLSSDSYEEERDYENPDAPTFPAKVPANLLKFYNDLCDWAENETGRQFVNRKKQYKAMKEMREMGYTIEEVKDMFKKMQNDKFWKDKQFDFMTVKSSIKMK